MTNADNNWLKIQFTIDEPTNAEKGTFNAIILTLREYVEEMESLEYDENRRTKILEQAKLLIETLEVGL